jgi:hypothetical protein
MNKWIRPAAGVVLVGLGVLWVVQGSGSKNSGGMSGYSQWIPVGIAAGLIGLVLLVGGIRRLRGGQR